MIVNLLMMASLHDAAAAARNTACAPPPEWGVTKLFAKWTVNHVCPFGADILSVGAASETGTEGGFAFICDQDGVGGRVVLNKIDVGFDPLSLTLKGGSGPALTTDGIGHGAELEASPATKRFEAALVDSPNPTFTLVVTPRSQPPVEMTFSRAGLAAAVKPLRSRCTW
ncbi:MAG: hypothetical protein ABJA98_25110 [Acidobacteriota bacterium]